MPRPQRPSKAPPTLTPAGDPARDRALAAAGNMWIAAGQPGKAALALDKALAGTGLQAEQHGLALLDRARAAEAQGDLKTARAKVGEAAKTISEDPYLWYFSAALAVREEDIPAAKASINRALAMAPDSAEVLFEAGHVAKAAGEDAQAPGILDPSDQGRPQRSRRQGGARGAGDDRRAAHRHQSGRERGRTVTARARTRIPNSRGYPASMS